MDWEYRWYQRGNGPPKWFKENEQMAGRLYEIRSRIKGVFSPDILCTKCRKLMFTVYRANCDHYFCGPCSVVFFENQNWEHENCRLSQLKKIGTRPNVLHLKRGEKEDGIVDRVWEETINCPWKCSERVLVQNIFIHENACLNLVPVQVLDVQAQPGITQKKFKELQDSCSDKIRDLEGVMGTSQLNNINLEPELGVLADKLNRLKALFACYSSMCAHFLGCRKFNPNRRYDNRAGIGNLEGNMNALQLKNSSNRESELLNLNDKLGQIKALFARYISMCSLCVQLFRCREWFFLDRQDRISIESIMANSPFARVVLGRCKCTIDLTVLTKPLEEAQRILYPSGIHQVTLFEPPHHFQFQPNPKFQFGGSFTVTYVGPSFDPRACPKDQLMIMHLSPLPDADDEFRQWPLRGTAILRLMDDQKNFVFACKKVLKAVEATPANKTPWDIVFPQFSMNDLRNHVKYPNIGWMQFDVVILEAPVENVPE